MLILALTVDELREDAAGAPNVDLRPIVLLYEDDIRWSVPSRDNVVAQASLFPPGTNLTILLIQFVCNFLFGDRPLILYKYFHLIIVVRNRFRKCSGEPKVTNLYVAVLV